MNNYVIQILVLSGYWLWSISYIYLFRSYLSILIGFQFIYFVCFFLLFLLVMEYHLFTFFLIVSLHLDRFLFSLFFSLFFCCWLFSISCFVFIINIYSHIQHLENKDNIRFCKNNIHFYKNITIKSDDKLQWMYVTCIFQMFEDKLLCLNSMYNMSLFIFIIPIRVRAFHNLHLDQNQLR